MQVDKTEVLKELERFINDVDYTYAGNYFYQHDKFSASEFIVEQISQRIHL